MRNNENVNPIIEMFFSQLFVSWCFVPRLIFIRGRFESSLKTNNLVIGARAIVKFRTKCEETQHSRETNSVCHITD